MMARVIDWILVLIIGGLFIVAGLLKAWDPGSLGEELIAFQLLPDGLELPVALYLPYLEIIAGIAVIAGPWRAGARLVLAGLTVVFITVLAITWGRGLDVSCGCFGSFSAETANYGLLILRNTCILLGLVWLHYRDSSRPPPS